MSKTTQETADQILDRITNATQGRVLALLQNPVIGYNAVIGTMLRQGDNIIFADLHLIHLHTSAPIGHLNVTASSPRILALAVPGTDVTWTLADPSTLADIQAAIDRWTAAGNTPTMPCCAPLQG